MRHFNTKFALIVGSLALMLVATPAFAQDAAAVADNVTGQFGSFGKLILGAMFLVGIGFGGLSALKFKAHAEEPQRNKLGLPIGLALVAAALIALPTFINTGTGTLFGAGAQTSDIEGNGVDLIGG